MDEEYEVPSPHERALEAAAEDGRDRLAQRVALMTAVLSTLGALISYESGSAQTEAMFLKNESILAQARANDQWALYQAKSTKGHIAEATAALAVAPDVRAYFLASKTKEDADKVVTKREAVRLESESTRLGAESQAKLKPHERLALAMTFIQIAVALAAITVLTRRRWLLAGSLASAALGVCVAATAYFIR